MVNTRGENTKSKYKLYKTITDETIYCSTRAELCEYCDLSINQIRRLLKNGNNFKYSCKMKPFEITVLGKEDQIKRQPIDKTKVPVHKENRIKSFNKKYYVKDGLEYVEFDNKKYLMTLVD